MRPASKSEAAHANFANPTVPYALDWTVDTSGENCKKGLPRSVLKNTDFQYLSTMHFRMQVRLKKTVVKEYSLHAIMDILLGILLRNVIYP